MHTGRNCRDLVSTISDYIDGELTAARCRDLETHLTACPCCDRFTDSLRRAVAVCRAAGETRLPSAVQRRARARIAELLGELSPGATPADRPRTRAAAPAAKVKTTPTVKTRTTRTVSAARRTR